MYMMLQVIHGHCCRGWCLLYISRVFFLFSSLYHRIHAHGSPQLPYRNILCCMCTWIVSLSTVWCLVWEWRLVWRWWLYQDMHQDQGNASHAWWSIRVRIWEIIHIRALGPRDRQANQEVKEASKVTSLCRVYASDSTWIQEVRLLLGFNLQSLNYIRTLIKRYLISLQRLPRLPPVILIPYNLDASILIFLQVAYPSSPGTILFGFEVLKSSKVKQSNFE